MCLVKEGCKKKAKEDIVCYKVMSCLEDGSDIRSLFYSKCCWNLGETKIGKKAPTAFWKDQVDGGYFHTYASKALCYFALIYERSKHSLIERRLEMYQCIIPAGSYYYAGRHSDGTEGFASKKLIIEKLIENE